MSCHVRAVLQWQLHLLSLSLLPEGQDSAITDTLATCQITHLKSTPSLLPSSSPPLCSFHISTTHYIPTSWFYNAYRLKSLQTWHLSFIAWLVHISPHSYCNLIWVISFHAPFEPYTISCSHFTLSSPIVLWKIQHSLHLSLHVQRWQKKRKGIWTSIWKETGWL